MPIYGTVSCSLCFDHLNHSDSSPLPLTKNLLVSLLPNSESSDAESTFSPHLSPPSLLLIFPPLTSSLTKALVWYLRMSIYLHRIKMVLCSFSSGKPLYRVTKCLVDLAFVDISVGSYGHALVVAAHYLSTNESLILPVVSFSK